MYLDKVLIKHPNFCIVPRKELVCDFPFLGKKIIRNKKKHCKMLLKELYHFANQKSFSNLHLKLSTISILKMCFVKNFALALFIALSVIAATLFITAKHNAIFMLEQLNIWDFCI